HAIDIRSDVYSLGAVLFELLTGQLPHPVMGLPTHVAARMIKEQPPQRLSRLEPALRGDLETIVQTALHKDRQWRYQNAGELRDNIELFRRNEPIIMRRPSVLPLLQTHGRAFVRRHPIWAYAGAGLFAGLVAQSVIGLIVYGTPLHEWYRKGLEVVAQ